MNTANATPRGSRTRTRRHRPRRGDPRRPLLRAELRAQLGERLVLECLRVSSRGEHGRRSGHRCSPRPGRCQRAAWSQTERSQAVVSCSLPESLPHLARRRARAGRPDPTSTSARRSRAPASSASRRATSMPEMSGRLTSSSTRSTSGRSASAASASRPRVAVPTSSKPGVAATTSPTLRRNDADVVDGEHPHRSARRPRLDHRPFIVIAADPKRLVEVEREDQCAQSEFPRPGAQFGWVVDEALVVLGVEHRLVLLDERSVDVALVVLVALLVDARSRTRRRSVANLIDVVLQADQQTPRSAAAATRGNRL